MSFISKYINLVLTYPKQILLIVFISLVISLIGLNNFKLDASSDALVLENDLAFKIYQESGDEFGGSDFLIVTFKPFNELFSKKSLQTLSDLEMNLSKVQELKMYFHF